ncbi:GntR family transcriptional regulator [Alkalihalobacillus sp. LMS6]|jgi:DNA-binding transcriptional regulator YhcF (GntR family)|uniref:GntR family transcriptional regulator n=1 Tax=Bacillaceae TaxID=186817 RepID=UPI000C085F7C|nr:MULTISPECIES: GntR family transcriptional regulator [Bacillaceae]UTR07235.1 GntR family transcriptional regulator [Alkalihalobacillus sp. LMS6]
MNPLNNGDKPLYLQIKELIEDQIVNEQLLEGSQAPSTNQLVKFYGLNHVTVAKGINLLVDDEILFKKRGIGMFVSEGAKEKLINSRKSEFVDKYVLKMIQEADRLGISEDELIQFVRNMKKGEG